MGTGGIGKTLTARYFGRKFREAVLKRGIKLTIEYYDCLQHRTKSSILRNISEKLHYSAGHGYSDNEIMEQILKELRKREESLLIILDEIHNLSSDDILALFNASIGFGEKNTRFCIIAVTRPADWYKVDNEKISSRVQDTIRMQHYTREEAFEILEKGIKAVPNIGILHHALGLWYVQNKVSDKAEKSFGFPISIKASEHEDKKNSSLENEGVVDLDDKIFSSKYSSMGLWSPAKFIIKAGINIYSLEPYDKSKTPILYIHGAGGSPRDFNYLANNEEIPENCFTFPSLAFLYRDFISRFSQIFRGVSIKTSLNLSTPTICLIFSLILFVGVMKAHNVIMPELLIILAISAVLLLFSSRSDVLNPRSLLRDFLTSSPSNIIDGMPLSASALCRFIARVDLPLAENPVNQMV